MNQAHSPEVAIPSLPSQNNPHFLRALTTLAETSEVQICEDVYSQNGTKLLARGARVTPELYDRIIQHRLRSPIENSLACAEPLDTNTLRNMAEKDLEETPFLRAFCNWSQGRVTPLGVLERLSFSPQATTLLAVAERHSPNNRPHHIRVSLIAMGLANAWRYNDPQLLASVCTAGMFHDIGELYVDPTIGQGGQEVTARQWMSISSHPIISAALARDVAKLDKTTQFAILDHHERVDGFGYPRSRRGAEISAAGQILGTAEMLAALIGREQPRQHIDIALKIMPGEFPPDLVSLIHALLEDYPKSMPKEDDDADVPSEIHHVFSCIAATQNVYADWQTAGCTFSPLAQAAIDDVFDRFMRVQRAFASTGMDGLEAIAQTLSAEDLREARAEASCVLNEISWRLTRISRELALRCTKMPEEEARGLILLIDALAGRTPTGD